MYFFFTFVVLCIKNLFYYK